MGTIFWDGGSTILHDRVVSESYILNQGLIIVERGNLNIGF